MCPPGLATLRPPRWHPDPSWPGPAPCSRLHFQSGNVNVFHLFPPPPPPPRRPPTHLPKRALLAVPKMANTCFVLFLGVAVLAAALPTSTAAKAKPTLSYSERGGHTPCVPRVAPVTHSARSHGRASVQLAVKNHASLLWYSRVYFFQRSAGPASLRGRPADLAGPHTAAPALSNAPPHLPCRTPQRFRPAMSSSLPLPT